MVLKLAAQIASNRVVFNGPKTGKPYEYRPARDEGRIEVDDEDVEELIKLVRESGCGCSKPGMGDGVQEAKVKFNLFTKE